MTSKPPPPTPATTGPHALFTLWAREHGIRFPKLIPAYLPPAGLGIISTSEITGPSITRQGKTNIVAPGEVIAFTPTSLLLTRENVEDFSPGCGIGRLFGGKRGGGEGLSSHAGFAAAIAREARLLKGGDGGNKWREWMDVWPREEEFGISMPIMWSLEECALLPPSTLRLLEEQKEKFKRDYKMVSEKGFEFSKEEYMWAWIVGLSSLFLQRIHSWKITRWTKFYVLVNTRTLFYKPPLPAYTDLPREDCMALCPFIDYFNHSDDGVLPPSPTIPPQTQLFVTYGCHSNDFLLIEYGFTLPLAKNKWDEVSITPLLLPLLSEEHKRVLASEGFLGEYAFDKEAFCFRTLAAVRLLLIQHPEADASWRKLAAWKDFLAGRDDGERERWAVEERLLGFLRRIEEIGGDALAKVEGLGREGVKEVVRMRWGQVLKMASDVRGNMLGEDGEGRGGRSRLCF
ncbi:SET domain-containing protein [Choiromyces venosus 120613-1]|uniref:SET domain-containing protein n=1 Tax=Choiromyces venosus 120613-1 TaxID=1336337 RepID=A0A3N4K687_9PEZI|nr:SET domain-containing protein [Choiromyces venosus 120613-1]